MNESIGKPAAPSGIQARCTLYDANGARNIDLEQIDLSCIADKQLIWVDARIGMGAPEKINGFPSSLNLGAESRQFDWTQSGDVLMFSVPVAALDDAKPWPMLRFICGPNWVVTLTDSTLNFFEEFRDGKSLGRLNGALSSEALVCALAIENIDEFTKLADDIDQKVDELDERVLSDDYRRDVVETIAKMRNQLKLLRRKVAVQRPVIHAMVRPDVVDTLPDLNVHHYRELEHVFERLEDDVLRLREAVLGSFELYSTRMTEDTNRLIKALTVITVITGALSVIAGVYGMNFEIEYFKTNETGFNAVLAGMGATALIILLLAWWRNRR